jgi:uncharacterized protein
MKVQKIFVNLPVKNLDKSIKFFTKLGFTFNPKFTDKNAAGMIIGKNMHSMLITEKFFKTFTKKKIVNAKKDVEVLTALSLNSKKEVDKMLSIALKAGAKKIAAYDHGWMYGQDFEDLDGHIWEIFYMDESKFPKK